MPKRRYMYFEFVEMEPAYMYLLFLEQKDVKFG